MSGLISDWRLYKHLLTLSESGCLTNTQQSKLPLWVSWMSSNQHFLVNIFCGIVPTNHFITSDRVNTLDVAHPSYQCEDNKRWKQLPPDAERHPDTALSVNKVSRARWTPKFSAKLYLPLPSLFTRTSKMLTRGEVQNCQCRKMKCSCTSHFVRAPQPGTLHN